MIQKLDKNRIVTFLVIAILVAPTPGVLFGTRSTQIIDLSILLIGTLMLWIFLLSDKTSLNELRTSVLKDPAILFIVFASLSVIASTVYGSIFFSQETSITDAYEIYRYVFYLVYYLMICFYLTDVRKFFKALFITVIAIEVFGILQFFNLFNINNHFGLLYTKNELLQMMIQKQHRITGTFGNPNVYGSFLIIVLSLALSIFYLKKNADAKFKFYLYTTIGLTLLSIFLTTSRQTVIVTLGLIVYLSIFHLIIRHVSFKEALVKTLVVLAAYGLIGFITVPQIPYLHSAVQSMAKVFQSDGKPAVVEDEDPSIDELLENESPKVKEALESVNSFKNRYYYWDLNIEKFKQSPILGAGPMKNGLSFADNSYLYVLARYGIIGFIIYLLFFGYIFIKSFLLAFKERETTGRTYLAVTLNGMIVAYAVLGLVVESWFNVESIIIFFILLALLKKENGKSLRLS